jgi:hypothetical protein
MSFKNPIVVGAPGMPGEGAECSGEASVLAPSRHDGARPARCQCRIGLTASQSRGVISATPLAQQAAHRAGGDLEVVGDERDAPEARGLVRARPGRRLGRPDDLDERLLEQQEPLAQRPLRGARVADAAQREAGGLERLERAGGVRRGDDHVVDGRHAVGVRRGGAGRGGGRDRRGQPVDAVRGGDRAVERPRRDAALAAAEDEVGRADAHAPVAANREARRRPFLRARRDVQLDQAGPWVGVAHAGAASPVSVRAASEA